MSGTYQKPVLKELGDFRNLTLSGAGVLSDGCTVTGAYDPVTGTGLPVCGQGGGRS